MAKYSKADLICLHNILAKKKSLPELDYATCNLAIPEICDKIEQVNEYKPGESKPTGPQYTQKMEVFSVAWFVKIFTTKLF